MRVGARFVKLLLIATIVCSPVFAQDDCLYRDVNGECLDVTDNPVPFDGGISLLVAAGIGYGLKRVHDKKKKQTF
jgi:hypothetical protein